MEQVTQNIAELIKKNQMIPVDIYNEYFIEKVIDKRIDILKLDNKNLYYSYIQKNGVEQQEFAQQLLISHSKFFRTPIQFEYLRNVVLPSLIKQKAVSHDSLRIWSAACATGEEPYSLTMTVFDALRYSKQDVMLHIIATDLSDKSLAEAQKAEYASLKMNNVKMKYLAEYFEHTDKYKVVKKVRDAVIFAKYDLCSKKNQYPPESIYGNFDIIFCRNVMIYLNDNSLEQLFTKLYNAMSPQSWLFLGRTEIIPSRLSHLFIKEVPFLSVYRKR